jgi:hypothetical protein
MKCSNGFLSTLTKADEVVVTKLQNEHPSWALTYARRIAAQHKFYRLIHLLTVKAITSDEAEAIRSGELDRPDFWEVK